MSPRPGPAGLLGAGRRTLSRVHGDTGRVSAVPEDFDEFVTARWRELYAVATVTTGDPASGALATASALASLGGRWAQTTDSGAPTAAAHAAVLRAALAAATPAPPQPPAPRDPTHEPDDLGTDDDRITAALAAVLTEATPAARASLAAQQWWDEGAALVAAGAHTDVASAAADLAALHSGLAAAHAVALGRDERELAQALPAAVADLLEHQVDAAPVADPVALVAAARTRSTRRHRARLAGAGAGLALVVAAATLAWPALAGSGSSGPSPESGTWASVASWSPRGPLVADPTVASIAADAQAADPTARLLYAGPVGDTIAVVMTGATPADPMLSDGVPGPAMGEGYDGGQAFLRLWTAPTRLGAAALVSATIDGDPTARTGDLVALSVVQDDPVAAPAVLVMTRPSVADVHVTTGLLPQPDGSRVPEVLVLPLVDGVASHTPTSGAFTPRIAVEGYTGPPAGAVPTDIVLPASGPAIELADAQRTLLAGVTGQAADTLETTSVLEAVVPSETLDPDVFGTGAGPLRITVVTTFTPDGGRVRTSRLAGTAGAGRLDLPRAPGRGPVHRTPRPAGPPDPHPPHVRRGRPRRRHRAAAHPRRPAARQRHGARGAGHGVVRRRPPGHHVPPARPGPRRPRGLRRRPAPARRAARLTSATGPCFRMRAGLRRRRIWPRPARGVSVAA